MIYVVFTGEATPSGSFIEQFVGAYTNLTSAKKAAKRVDGVVRSVPYYDGVRA